MNPKLRRIRDSAVFSSEENTFRRQTDRMIRKAMSTLLNIAGEESKKRIISHIYGPVNHIVKHAGYYCAADSTTSAALLRVTELQIFS